MSDPQQLNEHERPFASRDLGRPPTRPNLIFILADDLGWMDLGCFGSPHIKTPVLDKMAADGMRFTHAYAGSCWCSATRYSLYTGRHPGRLLAGLEEPLRTRNEEHGIPHDHPTLASLLVDGGYETAMFGKWHCGWLPWYSPLKAGYQTFYGNLDGAVDYFEHIGTLGEPDLYEGETPIEETGYYTWMISDHAAEWIGERGDDPFYLQINYTAPHWPWEGPDDAAEGRRIRQEYEDGKVPFPLLHLDSGSLAKYAELVEALDTGIGRVLDALDAAGKADNTLIVFCSDNGGERWSMNWPFVGEKGDLNEGGIRVPFVLRWPAAIDGGQVSDRPNGTMDWTATFLDAAGVTPDPQYPLDGTSLLPWLVEGADYPDHDLYWRVASQGAVRRGKWKFLIDRRPRPLLGNWPRYPGTWELLYDVTVDGREAANVARHHPDVVAELRAAYATYEAQLLPYAPDHRNLPETRHAAPGIPAVSEAD